MVVVVTWFSICSKSHLSDDFLGLVLWYSNVSYGYNTNSWYRNTKYTTPQKGKVTSGEGGVASLGPTVAHEGWQLEINMEYETGECLCILVPKSLHSCW